MMDSVFSVGKKEAAGWEYAVYLSLEKGKGMGSGDLCL